MVYTEYHHLQSCRGSARSRQPLTPGTCSGDPVTKLCSQGIRGPGCLNLFGKIQNDVASELNPSVIIAVSAMLIGVSPELAPDVRPVARNASSLIQVREQTRQMLMT